jgi:hypothetical protein
MPSYSNGEAEKDEKVRVLNDAFLDSEISVQAKEPFIFNK